MSWTKRQIVNAAFEDLGLGSYEFNIQPEQRQAALYRLDAMMGEWNAKGIRIGYPLPASPEDSDLDTESNLPDAANRAVYKNLAVEVAPTMGRIAPKELLIEAKKAYTTLFAFVKVPPKSRGYGGFMPAGAGHKMWRNGYKGIALPKEADQVESGADGPIDLE